MTKSSGARIYRPTGRNIAFLARRLQAGEVVAVPSETVYGLAGNALDARACAKIFRAKGRPADDPLIVHVHTLAHLDSICRPNAAALRLAKRFWPGPLTLVLPKTDAIPSIVTAGRASVAVRMPRHAVFRRLLKATGLPLAAPSANPFGYISPTTAAHVQDSLGDKIRYILDGGAAQIGLESTIVDLRNPTRPAVLRPGFISVAEIERVLQCPVASARRSASSRKETGEGQVAPGLLARHYSPRTAVRLHSKLVVPPRPNPSEAFLFLGPAARPQAANVFSLDPRGDLRGVARRLFATLRKLDTMDFTAIHVQLARGSGLAAAINDRLRRAAAR